MRYVVFAQERLNVVIIVSIGAGTEENYQFGAKVVHHGRYITFQLAEVAVPRNLFREILRLIDGLRPASLPP